MTGEDKELAEQQNRSYERDQKKKKRQEDEQRRQQQTVSGTCHLASDTSSINPKDEDNPSYSSDYYYYSVNPRTSRSSEDQSRKKSIKDLFTKHVTSALDRNKISDRQAVRIMVPISAAIGHDPSPLPISRSTIRGARKKTRLE